jgi:hypothetical protein
MLGCPIIRVSDELAVAWNEGPNAPTILLGLGGYEAS